jgi:hypothetical protein
MNEITFDVIDEGDDDSHWWVVTARMGQIEATAASSNLKDAKQKAKNELARQIQMVEERKKQINKERNK